MNIDNQQGIEPFSFTSKLGVPVGGVEPLSFTSKLNELIHYITRLTKIMKDFAGAAGRHTTVDGSENCNAHVIGIAGCTNSGKTTLANTLATMLSKEGMRTIVISQDTFYYRDEEHTNSVASRSNPEIQYLNFDTVEAINVDDFLSTLEEAIVANDFVIIEGNMILQIESLQKLIHRAVFVTLRRGICEERRATRNYNPPDLPGYVDEIVWPAYKSHLARAQKLARRSALIAFTDGNVQNFLNESEVKEVIFTLLFVNKRRILVSSRTCGKILLISRYHHHFVLKAKDSTGLKSPMGEKKRVVTRARNNGPFNAG
ncbi:unnamed protein product [Gongylonema pulchrum]|uniref:PRK domain-containing protein n=1 Tax=Gongylonema pulchrum TaxID=637853 RepID=A0A183DX19_9BILA|nr:unnamed protein product [Gongylonema pulchrum]